MRVGESREMRPSSGLRGTRLVGTQSKNRWLSRYEVVARAKAKVVTAR